MNETPIYFSKRKAIGTLLLLIPFAAFGLFLAFHFQDFSTKIYGILSFLLFGVFIGSYLKQFFNRQPQLIISETDIDTSKNEFVSWKEISNESVTVQYGRKGVSIYYLEFDHINTPVKFPIDGLTRSPTEIDNLIYEGRSKYEASSTVGY